MVDSTSHVSHKMLVTSHPARADEVTSHMRKRSLSAYPSSNCKRMCPERGTISASRSDKFFIMDRFVNEERISVGNQNLVKVGPSPLGLSCYLKMDVLSGRGGATNRHEGNIFFRDLVQMYRDRYLLAPKCAKSEISGTIVDIIRERNGRFLKQKESDGLWYEIGDDLAREKTGQALRQKGTERRRQLWREHAEKQRYRALQHDLHMRSGAYSHSFMPTLRMDRVEGLDQTYAERPYGIYSTMPPHQPEQFSFDEEHLAKYVSSKHKNSPIPDLDDEATPMMYHEQQYPGAYYHEEAIARYHRDRHINYWKDQSIGFSRRPGSRQTMSLYENRPYHAQQYPTDTSNISSTYPPCLPPWTNQR